MTEDGWFGAGYSGIKKTHPFLIKEGNRITRFKTLTEAAVGYARLQAGLPASLEVDDDDDDDEEEEEEEAEEEGEAEDADGEAEEGEEVNGEGTTR